MVHFVELFNHTLNRTYNHTKSKHVLLATFLQLLFHVSCESARCSFYVQGALVFNELPKEWQKERDLSKFKSSLKKL